MKLFFQLLPFLFFIATTHAVVPPPERLKTDIVKKQSPYSVKETMDRFEKIVNKKGLTVFARIDHQAGAKSVGLEMNQAQVLILGNPKMGTDLMKHDIAAALDLPLRVVVYADNNGKTWIAYHNPQSFKDYYNVDKSPSLAKAEGALDKLTSATIKQIGSN